jgi:hypothetical protein
VETVSSWKNFCSLFSWECFLYKAKLSKVATQLYSSLTRVISTCTGLDYFKCNTHNLKQLHIATSVIPDIQSSLHTGFQTSYDLPSYKILHIYLQYFISNSLYMLWLFNKAVSIAAFILHRMTCADINWRRLGRDMNASEERTASMFAFILNLWYTTDPNGRQSVPRGQDTELLTVRSCVQILQRLIIVPQWKNSPLLMELWRFLYRVHKIPLLNPVLNPVSPVPIPILYALRSF